MGDNGFAAGYDYWGISEKPVIARSKATQQSCSADLASR
jgi:hypothetical protein